MQIEPRQYQKYPFLTKIDKDLVIREAFYDGVVPIETARDLNRIVRDWNRAGSFFPNGEALDAYARTFEHLEDVITNKIPEMESPPQNLRMYLLKVIECKLLDFIEETVEKTRTNHKNLRKAKWDAETFDLDAVDEKTRAMSEGQREARAQIKEVWPYLSKRSRHVLKLFLILESKEECARFDKKPWSTFKYHLEKAMAEFRACAKKLSETKKRRELTNDKH